MVEESKKSGNAYYFEPLRNELNDTFGVMKNINPDSVFSNLKGLQVAPNSDATNDDEDEVELISPNKDDSKKKERKREYINVLKLYKLFDNIRLLYNNKIILFFSSTASCATSQIMF